MNHSLATFLSDLQTKNAGLSAKILRFLHQKCDFKSCDKIESNIRAPVLLNLHLSNLLQKREFGKPYILSLFLNLLNKFIKS